MDYYVIVAVTIFSSHVKMYLKYWYYVHDDAQGHVFDQTNVDKRMSRCTHATA